tara:strand:+ start:455 stop:643 length:189 start_codon:yes stop_codon:yes gene_type:complete
MEHQQQEQVEVGVQVLDLVTQLHLLEIPDQVEVEQVLLDLTLDQLLLGQEQQILEAVVEAVF